MSAEHAALVEPLSIGLYAVTLAGEIDGKDIGILGAGPIGLGVVCRARDRGAHTISVTEPIEQRRALAGRLGALCTVHSDDPDRGERISRHCPDGLDVVFECCGQQEALDDAVGMLKPGGILVVVGIPSVQRVSFDIDLLRRKEIRLQNVRRQVDCVQPAIDFLSSGISRYEQIITHRFEFGRTPQAFALVDSYADGVEKAMIVMQ
jgi:L-iditol 2-dehydrogenase